MNLRHVAVRFCPREKFAVAPLDKHVQHGLVKSWIGRVTVRFPTAIQKIDLDATANWITAVYPNRSIAKIRSGFAVPRAELDDIDFVSGGANEMFAEISGKPARLQLQLRWNPRRDEQRPFTNTIGIAQLCVAIGEQTSRFKIMRTASPNVTCDRAHAIPGCSAFSEHALDTPDARTQADSSTCYPTGLADSAATCSCNTGSLSGGQILHNLLDQSRIAIAGRRTNTWGLFQLQGK